MTKWPTVDILFSSFAFNSIVMLQCVKSMSFVPWREMIPALSSTFSSFRLFFFSPLHISCPLSFFSFLLYLCSGVIHLQKWFEFKNHICMVFELLGQSVFDFLKDNLYCPFPLSQIYEFTKQIVTSVSCMNPSMIFCFFPRELICLVVCFSHSQPQVDSHRFKAWKHPAGEFCLPNGSISECPLKDPPSSPFHLPENHRLWIDHLRERLSQLCGVHEALQGAWNCLGCAS